MHHQQKDELNRAATIGLCGWASRAYHQPAHLRNSGTYHMCKDTVHSLTKQFSLHLKQAPRHATPVQTCQANLLLGSA